MLSRKSLIACASLFVLTAAVIFFATLGPSVAMAQDAPAPVVDTPAIAGVQPESCATCHKDAGEMHQASYDQLYQDGVIQITDMAYTFAPTGTHTVTFQMTKDGEPFNAAKADTLAIYFAAYSDGQFQFDPAEERLSINGDLSYDGAGGNTSTFVGDVPDLSDVDGFITIIGADEQVGSLPARVRLVKYPFAGIMETGGGVDYVSAANNDGCVKCHTDPYLKHGYIYAQVDGDPATDFLTCKACHQDNVEGGHFEWQLLVEDPALAADYLAGNVELTPEQQEAMAYKTSLMNDVHMSHAMEFPYPQSMANCATCHEGKLDTALSDENFTIETCRSCHPMNGSELAGNTNLGLTTILASVSAHDKIDINVDACTDCHETGSKTPGMNEIHSGYDKAIYTADGLRYSDAITVSVDSASLDGNMLTISLERGAGCSAG